MLLHDNIVQAGESDFLLSRDCNWLFTRDCKLPVACSAIIFGSDVHNGLLYILATFFYFAQVFQKPLYLMKTRQKGPCLKLVQQRSVKVADDLFTHVGASVV